MAKSAFKRRKLFVDLVPPLNAEERKELLVSIQAEGCREPVTLMQGDVLVDGHHRDEICVQLGIETPFRIKHFDSDDEAVAWALRTQLGRRNLSGKPLKLAIGRLYNLTKRCDDGHGNLVPKGQKPAVLSEGQNEPPIKTAENVAKEFSVSRETVKRAGKLATAHDSLASPAKKIAEKLTDAQVIALAAKPKDTQHEIARQIRVGQKTAAQAIPTNSKPKKPPKVVDEFKVGLDLYGKLVRWVDDMGGKRGKGREYKATLAAVKAVHDTIDEWRKAR